MTQLRITVIIYTIMSVEIDGPLLNPDTVNDDAEQSLQKNDSQRFLDWMDGFRSNHPYVSTAVEATLVWAGRAVAIAAINQASPVIVGHGWKDSRAGKFFQKPLVNIVGGLVLSPIAEEAALRLTPSRWLNERGRGGLEAGTGVVVAALFAAGHAGKNAVPLPQFVGGLNYWRLMRARGFTHSVLAHAIQNGLSLDGSKYLERQS